MAEKKEKSSHQDNVIKSLAIILTLIFVVFAVYMYWKSTSNKKVDVSKNVNTQQTSTKNDETRVEAYNLHKDSPVIQKLKVDDPANSTINNAKIVSVAPTENKIVVLDNAGKEAELVVTATSKMQKMTVLPEDKKLWQPVPIADLPDEVNATITYNNKNEVVYLVYMVSE